MTDDLPFFHRMLAALLEAPEDPAMDQMRAQITLESAGAVAVEAAINEGDAYAAALYRLALGDTRTELMQWIAGDAN
jgi:hypothetical protein